MEKVSKSIKLVSVEEGLPAVGDLCLWWDDTGKTLPKVAARDYVAEDWLDDYSHFLPCPQLWDALNNHQDD